MGSYDGWVRRRVDPYSIVFPMKSRDLDFGRPHKNDPDQLDLPSEQPCDFALVALNPLDPEGSAALAELKRMYPHQLILVLRGETAAAIRQVLERSGDGSLHADLRQRCIRTGCESLSKRESQVLQLLGLGMTVSQTAAALELSEKTVSTYRTRILQKLGLKTTAELVRYAVMNGLTH